jgi:hypothetical protein
MQSLCVSPSRLVCLGTGKRNSGQEGRQSSGLTEPALGKHVVQRELGHVTALIICDECAAGCGLNPGIPAPKARVFHCQAPKEAARSGRVTAGRSPCGGARANTNRDNQAQACTLVIKRTGEGEGPRRRTPIAALCRTWRRCVAHDGAGSGCTRNCALRVGARQGRCIQLLAVGKVPREVPCEAPGWREVPYCGTAARGGRTLLWVCANALTRWHRMGRPAALARKRRSRGSCVHGPAGESRTTRGHCTMYVECVQRLCTLYVL